MIFNVKLSEMISKLSLSNLKIAKALSDQKTSERATKESLDKYRNLAETLPLVVFEVNQEGNLTFVNQKATETTGYRKDEYGQNFNFLRLIVPSELDAAQEKLSRLMSGEKVTAQDFNIIRKDGSIFPALVWATPFIVKNKFAGIRGVLVDVTQEKKYQERLQKSLSELEVTKEKLKVIGGLTRHDIGNKLSVITSTVYLLNKSLQDNPKLLKYLETIDLVIEESKRLFEFGRIYEKIGSESLVEVDVSRTFREAIALFADLKTVKVTDNCEGLVLVADSLLRQLFYNLIDNSIKHGKKVTQIKLYCNKAESNTKLIYEDNGEGIPEKNKTKLFTEGFSTGDGTGFGLFLVKKVLDFYGWTITETGEPGKGAKFIITIPT